MEYLSVNEQKRMRAFTERFGDQVQIIGDDYLVTNVDVKTAQWGKELTERNIAVNCVTPAATKTRIFDQASKEVIEFMLSKIPRGRFLTVEEIASMML